MTAAKVHAGGEKVVCRRVSGELEKPVEGAPAGEKGQEFLFWGKLRSRVSTDLTTVLSAGWQRQRIHTAVPTDSHWVCGSNHLCVDCKLDTFTVGDRQTDIGQEAFQCLQPQVQTECVVARG